MFISVGEWTFGEGSEWILKGMSEFLANGGGTPSFLPVEKTLLPPKKKKCEKFNMLRCLWESLNKLTLVWGTTNHLYLPFFRRVVNSTLNRMFLDMYYKKLLVKACIWMWPLLILFRQSNHWILYFICQNHDKVQQENFFSFNHILCLHILSFTYENLLIFVFCLHSNALSSLNSIVMAATSVLWTNATVNCMWYTSALQVSV